MKYFRLAIASVWLLIGAAIGVWCIIDVFTASYRGEVIAAVIFLVFACLGVSGSLATIRNGRWGPPILYIGSLFGLFYGGIYWFFGGMEDTGWLYAAGVGLLVLLSLATLVGVRREVQHGL